MKKSIWCWLNIHDYEIDISYKFSNFKHITVRTKVCKECVKRAIKYKISNFGLVV